MKLHVLWTSGDKEVAKKVVFPYIINSKANGWWAEVNLIIWGPSAKIAAGEQEIVDELQFAMDSGVTVEACRACSDSYKLTENFLQKGISVRYMGDPFTQYLNGPDKVIIF